MSPNRQFRFSVNSIKALPLPEKGKKAYYQDTEVHGLELIVTHTGRKTFYLYRKFHGKPIRICIGAFPEKKIAQARGKVGKFKSLIAEGIDPRTINPALRGGMTLQQLFDEYIDKKKLPSCHPKTPVFMTAAA